MISILYLVRHGETEWNHIGKIQGHMNIPLNETGRYQAKQLANALADSGISKIYSSDLQRAYETASIIAKELNIQEVIKCPLLRERSFGSFEGMELKQLLAEIPDYETNWGIVDNSIIESLEALRKRSVSRIMDIVIESEGEKIIIVSHGAFINAFLYDITNGQQGPGITEILNTSYSTLLYDNESGWKIEFLNNNSHLSKR
ncbi:histidine phosphatase family protein [Metabacillus fastidiosus]|uniref:histidine phosphatase family protein n=1 Tax=Metabacillus fastidiosus TaxID=1458 RepID=UPI002E1F09F6|nr:histidine phosphatase family protein [Metabacillus fastidiosus]